MRPRGNLHAAIIAEARSCRHAGISTITQGAGAAWRPTNPRVATAPWAPPGPNPVVSLERAELGQALDLWAHAGASHDADQTPPTRPTRERAARRSTPLQPHRSGRLGRAERCCRLGRGAPVAAEPSHRAALHRHGLGALTSRPALLVTASAFAIAC